MEELLQTPITLLIVAANVAASLWAFANADFFEENTFHVGHVRAGQWHRVVSSGFIHVNGTHLFLNMFVLLQFGPPLEQLLGAGAYLTLYAAALLGGNVWALLDNWRKLDYRAVGASGAISGVIAAFCLFLPLVTLLLFFVIPMPALLVLVLLLVGSAYFSTRDNTIIGHEAHFGGALAGVLAALMFRPDAWAKFTEALGQLIG